MSLTPSGGRAGVTVADLREFVSQRVVAYSLLWPGLGHVNQGARIRGIALMVCSFLLYTVLSGIAFVYGMLELVASGGGSGSWYLFSMVLLFGTTVGGPYVLVSATLGSLAGIHARGLGDDPESSNEDVAGWFDWDRES